MSWGRPLREGPPLHDLQPQVVFDYGHARVRYDKPQEVRPPPNLYDPFAEEEDDDDDEEMIPLPEDLASKFGKLTCELCLCTLPTVKQANMHYEGKQHEKRVMRYLEEWSSSTNKKIPNCWLSLVRRRKQSSKLPPGSSEKFCSVCNLVLTSAVVAQQHYAGRSHNSALKLYTGNHSSGNIRSAANSMFMCDICNIVTSSQEHLENHMRGSKHKKVVERLKEAEYHEKYGDYEEEEPENVPEYNVIQSSSGGVQYECVYCTWRGPPFEFEAHKEKLTHMAAVEEESKRNADLDDDDDDDDADETEYTDVTDLLCKLCNIQLTSKKEVARHMKSRDHLGEVNLRKKQVMLSLDDPEKVVVEEEHKCDLCLMKFPSKSMYDAHLQWKRHIKKLANKMQSEAKKRCELCQMDFFSEKMYEAHLNTKRHRNSVQWVNESKSKSGTSSNSNSDTAKKNVEDKENKTNKEKPMAPEKPKSKSTEEIKNQEKSSKIKKDVKNSENLSSDSKKRSSDGKPLDKTPGKSTDKTADGDAPNESDIFECDVCQISVTGKVPFEQHLISTRHFLQCSLKQAANSDSTTKQNAKQQNAPAKTNKNKPFYCKLCHVSSLTDYQHELHVNSKKHKDAVTKLEVKKFEPKLKTATNSNPVVSTHTTFAAEKTQNFRGHENVDQSGNSERANFRQYENTVPPQRPVVIPSLTKMPTINHPNVAPPPFQQVLSSGARPFIALQPVIPSPAAPRLYFPPPHISFVQRVLPPGIERFPVPPPIVGTFPVAPPALGRFPGALPAVGRFPGALPAVGRFPVAPAAVGKFVVPPPAIERLPMPPRAAEGIAAAPPPVINSTQDSKKRTAVSPPSRTSTYSCRDCRATFISGVEYKQHVSVCKAKVGHDERKVLQPEASKSAVRKEPYSCEACDEQFTSYRSFLEHKASAEHEANIEHLRNFGKRLKPVRKEKRKQEPDEHWLSSESKQKGLHNSKSYECKRCDVSFYSEQAFNRHINSAGHLRKPATFKREILMFKREVQTMNSGPEREQRSRMQHSRSPEQRYLSPERGRSKSPERRRSRSLERRRLSPERRRSRSPERRRTRSPERRRSRSPVRRRSRSPVQRRSRSPVQRRSRSPVQRRSRSPVRRRSRSPEQRRLRSPEQRRSRSPERRRSRSPERRHSRSPERRRSRSPDWRYSRSSELKGKPGSRGMHLSNLKAISISSDSDTDGMDLLPPKKLKQFYKCKPCDKIYYSEQEYKDHLKSKMHKNMCLYECSDCSKFFSSKHEVANHMCHLGVGRIRSIEEGDSDDWLQNWNLEDQMEQRRTDKPGNVYSHQNRGPISFYQNSNKILDDNEEASQNLGSFQKQPETSLLTTFSFRKETYELMSCSPGMSGFNY